eukprot:g8481.t1
MEANDSFRSKIQKAKSENAKSRLDEDQREEFKEAFKVFDEDNGGSIDDEEFENLMKMLGYNMSDEELVAIFNAVDEEGEGEILFNDFLTLMVVLMENDTEEKNLITAFESLDKGNTGLISVKHVHDILKTIGEQMTSTEINKFISVADSDNDGMVDIVDIKRMLL